MPKVVQVPGVGNVEFPDSMNDDAIAAQIQKSMKSGNAAPATAVDPRAQLGKAVTDTLAGIGAGGFSTAVGAYNLIRKIPGADSILPAPNAYVQKLTEAPDSMAGSGGKMLEQAGEFILPMGAAAKAVKGAPILARLGAEALAAGGTAAVQTGGDPRAVAGTMASQALLGGVGAAIPASAKAAFARSIRATPNALSEGAKDMAARFGVPLTAGMEGGSKTVLAAEKLLGHTVAPDMYEPLIAAGQKGLRTGAKDLSGGFATDAYTAGANTTKTMLGKADELTSAATRDYQALAEHEANPANIREVQVGTKTNPAQSSAVLDASGRPVSSGPTTEPVMEKMGLPVDMRPTQEKLAPVIDEISRRMTPAQRNADPGLSAIKNILSRPAYLPASVAEADLGYLKSIMRSDASGQAKRLAGKAIESLEGQVNSAVEQAGPDALASLKNARQAWASREEVLSTVKQLTGDQTGQKGQVLLTQKLLQPADASFPALQKVLAVTPEAADDLGKAYLTNRVFKKVADGNGLTNPAQASNLWNHIGPRTKAALYPPETVANIDSFLELAKRVAENPNPSGTGVMNALLKAGIFVTHPVSGAAGFAFGRNVAKVLYNTEGAAALRTALTSPNAAEAGKAMTVVRALADKSAEGDPALAMGAQTPQSGTPLPGLPPQ